MVMVKTVIPLTDGIAVYAVNPAIARVSDNYMGDERIAADEARRILLAVDSGRDGDVAAVVVAVWENGSDASAITVEMVYREGGARGARGAFKREIDRVAASVAVDARQRVRQEWTNERIKEGMAEYWQTD